MKRSAPARSFSIGLILLSLLVACGGGAGPTATPVAPNPSATPATATPSATPAMATPTPTQLPTPTEAATSAPTVTPGLNLPVSVTQDIDYESSNPVLMPGTLDVYAPSAPGPWPVVVMLHGTPGTDPAADRAYLGQHSRAVAKLGFVVFNASWGAVLEGSIEHPTYEQLVANDSQAACAVEFARAKAADYGGDPSTMILFGHSGGAHAAAMATFARPAPSAGCLGGTTLGTIDALVTWEGSWILSVNYPDWDTALASDPRVFDAVAPWAYLAQHADQKVVMLVSDHPGVAFEREVGDPWAADSWLAARDPSGDLRRQLESNGAFADGILDFIEVQQLLFSVLQAQGNPVSLDVMPESIHDRLGAAGWPVFLAAFGKAAGRE